MQTFIQVLDQNKKQLEKAINYGRTQEIDFDSAEWEAVDDKIDSFKENNIHII